MDRGAFQEMVDVGDPAILRLGLELSRSLAQRVMTLNDKVVQLLAAEEDASPLREQFSQARQEIFTLWDYE
ncbi:MAG: hypothetical protein GWP91_06805, partial [Rhodobacterales bacterium]|nr:hypothetical protein [Rhodobacterales bacterium]